MGPSGMTPSYRYINRNGTLGKALRETGEGLLETLEKDFKSDPPLSGSWEG